MMRKLYDLRLNVDVHFFTNMRVSYKQAQEKIQIRIRVAKIRVRVSFKLALGSLPNLG